MSTPQDHRLLSLFIDHRAALVKYANGIIDDNGLAEDLVQEGWLRLKTAARKQVLNQPVGYLYQIIRNLSLDARRKQAREAANCQSDEAAILEVPDSSLTPEADAIEKQKIQLLEQALAELPERTRIAIEMRRFGGFKLVDIATHLKISKTTAHAILADGIEHCRRRMISKGLAEEGVSPTKGRSE